MKTIVLIDKRPYSKEGEEFEVKKIINSIRFIVGEKVSESEISSLIQTPTTRWRIEIVKE